MNPFKNYQIGTPMNDLGDVMAYLYKNPSVYFKPMNKVMPSKFFMNWAWMGKTAFLEHIEKSNFSPVKRREDVMRERIRKALSDCPKF